VAYSRDGKPASARNVGNRLRGMRGSVIAGMKFVEAGLDHSAVLWRVDGGDSDDSGTVVYPRARARERTVQ